MSLEKNSLLPVRAENSYRFNKIIVYIFAIVTAITIGRSLAHLFLPDGGANSIATIISFDGAPDPDKVIYNIFALWGLAQLAMGVMYLIILIRYKNLIPLMWLFILVEYVMRIVIGRVLKPMGEEYFAGTAPGEIGNYIFIPLAIIMLAWSLLAGNKKEST